MLHLHCHQCARSYDLAAAPWRCPCGGLLDLAPFPIAWPSQASLAARSATLWRYREALPFAAESDAWRAVTMGEGMTPLVMVDRSMPGVLAKVEYLAPTLSFKDRGAAVLIAHAREIGVRRVVADSSGNAGAAIAAYAARAGIACEVFVPAQASPYKIRQITQYGATARIIAGTREDVAAAAITAVEHEGAFYASHVYHPLFFQGTKTYAYEIWEQLGGRAPAAIILPAGNGTLALGAYYGFGDLLRLGLIAALPVLLAVQAAGCAPLAARFRGQAPSAPAPTIAEGIAIAAPARGEQILAAIRAMQGDIITITDDEVRAAQHELAQHGFDVEPTGAVSWAALRRAACEHQESGAWPTLGTALVAGEPVVLPLCGAGAKAAK